MKVRGPIAPAHMATAAALALLPGGAVTLEASRRIEVRPMVREARVSVTGWHLTAPAPQEVALMAAQRPLAVTVSSSRVESQYEEGVRALVSQLWAEDWDSPEDSVYDTW